MLTGCNSLSFAVAAPTPPSDHLLKQVLEHASKQGLPAGNTALGVSHAVTSELFRHVAGRCRSRVWNQLVSLVVLGTSSAASTLRA